MSVYKEWHATSSVSPIILSSHAPDKIITNTRMCHGRKPPYLFGLFINLGL